MHDGVKVDEDRDIIEVCSYSDSSKEDIARAIREAMQILEDRGINKILADTTKQSSLPNILAIFDLFSTFPREFRTAILLKKNQKTEKDLYFAETVAINRGIVMKMFYDREKALLWLGDG